VVCAVDEPDRVGSEGGDLEGSPPAES
jgi:hypothetical protein